MRGAPLRIRLLGGGCLRTTIMSSDGLTTLWWRAIALAVVVFLVAMIIGSAT